jgi:hypothetical protein
VSDEEQHSQEARRYVSGDPRLLRIAQSIEYYLMDQAVFGRSYTAYDIVRHLDLSGLL